MYEAQKRVSSLEASASYTPDVGSGTPVFHKLAYAHISARGSGLDKAQISDVREYLSLIAEGDEALAAKKEGRKAVGLRGKKSRRVDRDYYRSCVSDGSRDVAYDFLPNTWRLGFVCQRMIDSQDGRFDFASKQLPSDGGDPRTFQPPTPNLALEEYSDDAIISGKIVIEAEDEGDAGEAADADPLKRARYVGAMEMAYEPAVRYAMRKVYFQRAIISTVPTC